MHHIREALPDLKLKIAQQLAKYRAELAELGDQLADSDSYLVRALSARPPLMLLCCCDANANALPLSGSRVGRRT